MSELPNGVNNRLSHATSLEALPTNGVPISIEDALKIRAVVPCFASRALAAFTEKDRADKAAAHIASVEARHQATCRMIAYFDTLRAKLIEIGVNDCEIDLPVETEEVNFENGVILKRMVPYLLVDSIKFCLHYDDSRDDGVTCLYIAYDQYNTTGNCKGVCLLLVKSMEDVGAHIDETMNGYKNHHYSSRFAQQITRVLEKNLWDAVHCVPILSLQPIPGRQCLPGFRMARYHRES